jgi:hypothetical protein
VVPDPDPRKAKMTHKKKQKSEEISCFKVQDVLGGAGGLSCSWRAHHRGIRIKM